MRWLLLLCVVAWSSAWGAERLVRDATGLVLGEFVSIEGGDISIMTQRGYLTIVSGKHGVIRAPDETGWTVYLDAQCAGQPYARDIFISPLVFAGADGVSYVGPDAVTTRLAVGDAYYTQPTCHRWEIGPNSDPLMVTPLVPNDPAVTGIGNGPFLPPFKISAAVLLVDGFEGA